MYVRNVGKTGYLASGQERSGCNQLQVRSGAAENIRPELSPLCDAEARAAQHGQGICGQPCYKPALHKDPLTGLLLWERYNYGQIGMAMGTNQKVVWGWTELLFSSKRILADHLG